MNSQQYNRANKRVFLAVIIVFAYIAFTLFAAVGTKDADITRISIQLVAAIAVIVIAVIAFITKRDSRTGALILVSAMTAGYFIIALINSTIGTTVVDKFIAEIFQTHKKTPFPSWQTTKERVKNC
mgnify:CR=1 FL=1